MLVNEAQCGSDEPSKVVSTYGKYPMTRTYRMMPKFHVSPASPS